MTKTYDQICPIARTLDVLGDRWTMLILRDLFFGHARFSELLETCPGIPPKVLSERLKRLEEHDLVERAVYSEHPLRAEYHLTPTGRSLGPVLEAIALWGVDHRFEDEPALREAVREKVAEVAPLFSPAGPKV